MPSIFQLINQYQDLIIAFVTLVLGLIQSGVSSWAIHKLVLDEHFLIYIIGHAMYKKTKNLQEAMAHYSSIREFLRQDLFETMDFIKIAFSIALVSGVFQALASLLLICLRKKSHIRKIWIAISTLTLSGLFGGFGLGMYFVVPNIVYFQIFLSTTGVNFFILLHLTMSMLAQEIFGSKNEPESENLDNDETELESESKTTEVETQTPSIALDIQEEFPLPLPPPSPNVATTRASSSTGTTSGSGSAPNNANSSN